MTTATMDYFGVEPGYSVTVAGIVDDRTTPYSLRSMGPTAVHFQSSEGCVLRPRLVSVDEVWDQLGSRWVKPTPEQVAAVRERFEAELKPDCRGCRRGYLIEHIEMVLFKAWDEEHGG
jgi:hypothetical protein